MAAYSDFLFKSNDQMMVVGFCNVFKNSLYSTNLSALYMIILIASNIQTTSNKSDRLLRKVIIFIYLDGHLLVANILCNGDIQWHTHTIDELTKTKQLFFFFNLRLV